MILGEQSRAAERFTWSEFQPIPPKGADLRLLWSPMVTANSLALEQSMAWRGSCAGQSFTRSWEGPEI